jgi:uncharacterized protein (UPF0332 family)
MKSNKLNWCIKQKKGLKLVEPNENLCGAYIRKAESSLNILKSALEKNEIDWITTISYYAKYFSLYALFIKCGIKCEIHDCTIKAMKILFVEEKIIDENLYKDILVKIVSIDLLRMKGFIV